MACPEETMKYNNITDILFNTFAEVIDRDTIYSIVESSCGDLNIAANIIMSVTSEENTQKLPVESTSYIWPSINTIDYEIPSTECSRNKKNGTSSTPSIETKSIDIPSLPKVSYARASTSKKETTHKQTKSSLRGFLGISKYNNCNIWTEQIKQIVTYHNQGTRTLIIMRGAPGSGKSYLARQIQEMTVGAAPQNIHIFCTDDYFMVNGKYKYDKANIHQAHLWNQSRAFEALNKGVSPVIIDNTNIEYWEIQPYAITGVYNGYLLEVVEPNTPWARNLYQLTKRNKHGVPLNTIKRMLNSLATPITSASLITYLNLVYPIGMEPPVLRCVPEFFPCSNDTAEQKLQEKHIEIQDSKIDVEDKKYSVNTSQNSINGESYLEKNEVNVSTHLAEQTKCTVQGEGNHIGLSLLPLNCAADITDDLGDIPHETKEKQNLNKQVETITTSENQNNILESKLIDQDETKKDEVIYGIDDKVEENDIQNIPQPFYPTVCIEGEGILKETSKSTASICTENRGEQPKIGEILENFHNVLTEWDNGEAWEEDTNTKNIEQISIELNTKVPKNKRTKENENPLKTLHVENDWRNMYAFASLTDHDYLSSVSPKNMVETKSTETCMEVGDTDISNLKNGYKIIPAIPRDININYVPNLPESIPENRKFDKSSMTNEVTIMLRPHRCRNEDKHFIRFRNMFKHLKEDELRDIFDKCCGDVNWAVSIVMDAMPNNQFEYIALDEQSEIEGDCKEHCGCTSSYGIIPDVTSGNKQEENIFNESCSADISTDTSNPIKKPKKDAPLSDSSLALKRQIEQNIVISDQHYSEQCLKIRKMRRGASDGDVSTSQNIDTGITMQRSNQLDTFNTLSIDTCNRDEEIEDVSGPSTFEGVDSEYNSDDDSMYNEVEKTVNIKLGHEFLKQLDALFGRADMEYWDNVDPTISMPLSMLSKINDLWIESLMSQLENESKVHENMIKEDEELARQLYMEQIQISNTTKEPEVPNLKEIMDMEFALSLYRKDCEGLMDKGRPTDIAAKLSSKKLYALFPEIPQADLDEILMAHHYDFRTTVGVLLESQGRTDITENKNGINKFIVDQELKRQEEFLMAEKKRLMEKEIPDLKEINMSTVELYRRKANSHLENWKENIGKAKQMTKKNASVASYYNNIASLHLLKFKEANCIASAGLLRINARSIYKCYKIDLHFFRVNEAIATVDMFLDSHIQQLRSSCGQFVKLHIITGRGLHSISIPKIKLAVMNHLQRRGLNYSCSPCNPGMLAVTVHPKHKLSSQIEGKK